MKEVFMPLVCSYYAISASVFINVSVHDANGMEGIANTLLSPVHYLFAGKEARERPDGSWEFVQRFDYTDRFWIKTASCLVSLPASFILGTPAKALSLLETKSHYTAILAAKESKEVLSNIAVYRNMGIDLEPIATALVPLGCARKAGDEGKFTLEKEALRDIAQVFNESGIPWWVDCGTCLGAYRYGGIIPWDDDIDIAVLQSDFDNVCHALNRLDRNKYHIQDWSTRDHPNSFLKLYIRQTGTLIDIYHFAIDADSKELNYILSLETNMFFPEWWKIRERAFKIPVSFETVFPLRKAQFDGVDIFVPNDTKKYLQRCYGEDLTPVKIYDPKTDRYEKDLSHPYWLRVYAH